MSQGTAGAVDDTEAMQTAEQPEAGAPAAATGRTPRQPKGAGATRLEEEGDVAADYLEELLDIVDLDGDIDIDIENGRASVAIVADGAGTPALRKLVGSDGEVLEALQELTRLAVQAQTGDRTRLLLDVAGFRAEKRTSLIGLAQEVVARVRASGTDEKLDPMPAFERKVVHDAVAAAGLESESEGEEPRRRVVVLAPEAAGDAPSA
ncbi:Jag family protein [Kineococcus rubinsiae]|uniref:Jag family protein n=1 Tax=Kineococcus rubinsiae TaxID=2609562 RepID=UPI0027E3F9E3|nr:R3H domain-containing nucleic acid-binding protein [Kineococcus rubinsiae]